MDLLVKAQFDNTLKVMNLTDLIAGEYNTTHGYTLSECKGMFKITGPNSVLYVNDGWDAEDYSAPDTEGATPDWTKLSINLPLDASGNVLMGVYQVEYMVSLDGSGDTNFTFDKTYTNMYVAPVPSIVATTIVEQSYMVISDGTNYELNVAGVLYNPTNTLTDTRVMLARWPLGSGQSDTTTNEISMRLGPNLWTGNYDVSLDVVATYELPADTGLTVEISDTISGTKDDINVSPDTWIQATSDCLIKLTAQYEQAKNYNLPEAQVIKKNLDDIGLYYEMYKMAVQTNADTTYATTNLQRLFSLNGCEVSGSTTVSVEILPGSAITGRNEFTVTDAGGQSSFDLTFTLNISSKVFVEGQIISNALLTGFGTETMGTTWTVPQGQTVIVIE